MKSLFINLFYSKQFIKFIVVGTINTLSFMIISSIFDQFMQPLISYSLSFFITLILSYTLNAYWTYKETFNFKTFILFPLTYIPTYITQISSFYLFYNLLHINIQLAKILSVGAGVPISYIFLTYIFKGLDKKLHTK